MFFVSNFSVDQLMLYILHEAMSPATQASLVQSVTGANVFPIINPVYLLFGFTYQS